MKCIMILMVGNLNCNNEEPECNLTFRYSTYENNLL